MQTLKSTGCVLDWRGGTRDFSRYHHSLTEHNTIPVRGVNGEARYFNGVDAYLDCGNPASLNITDAITIEAWINLESLTYFNVIVGKYGAIENRSYLLYFHSGNAKYSLHITSNDLSYEEAFSPTVTANVYQHVVGVYDGSYITTYLNSLSGTSVFFNKPIDVSTVDLWLGNSVGYTQWINGTISSVKVYNRALTPLEIWNNYVTMKPYIPLSESPVAIV